MFGRHLRDISESDGVVEWLLCILSLLHPPSVNMSRIHFACMIIAMVMITTPVDSNGIASEVIKSHDNNNRKLAEKSAKGKGRQLQKAAIAAWADYLNPERDYNATTWITKKRNQPQYVFDYYVTLLSDIFEKEGAMVNFALVGACDGTNDYTIRERFLPNEHWQALFVEPISLNFADLNQYLLDNKVSERSHTIKAAVTNECKSATIIVKTPDVDKTTEDISQPHWMRRQIGGIVDINPDTGKPRIPNNWKAEEVKCISGGDLLKEWAVATSRKKPGKSKKLANIDQKRRPHILKIDAEGHDYQVLASFLTNDTKNNELPFLINFEAKTMFDNYPLARQVLESRGYVVSNFATDGFAMLKAEYFYKTKDGKKKRVAAESN